MDKDQDQRFREALERKHEDAEAKAAAGPQNPGAGKAQDAGAQDSLVDSQTPQDVTDPRAKNEGHGKKTADNWNQ